MPSPPTITIQPQRMVQGHWTPCPEHAAQRWAVLSNGKRVCAFTEKRTAKSYAAALLRNTARKAAATANPSGGPGSRYGKLGVRGGGKIIASSLDAPANQHPMAEWPEEKD